MNKAFTKESDDAPEEDSPEEAWPLPPGVKNYLTPSGEQALKAELAGKLAALEAPVDPRSRRELERRVRVLERRLAEGEVVDPARQPKDRVLFGARVNVRDTGEVESSYWIVGIDQADPGRGWLSWRSAIARALLGARIGDIVRFETPAGPRELEVVSIDHPI